MPQILFEAPVLYDPDAPPLDDPKGFFHDARGMLAPLGREKRLAFWVRDQLRDKGLKVLGPKADESGWGVQVNADGGFVIIFIGYDKDTSVFSLLIHGFDAAAAAARTAETLKVVLEKTEGVVVLEFDRDA